MSIEGFEDFVPLNKMDLIVTDLIVLNKKEKAPRNYIVIEPPINEGGRLSFGKRYLAYTRELPNRMGRVALTDIRIINSGDRPPIKYRQLTETYDDNVNSFSSKVVIVKIEPFEDVSEAVTEIVVLSGSKKEHVPSGYKRLPEVNGFSICFALQKINRSEQQQQSGLAPSSTTSMPPPSSGMVPNTTANSRSGTDTDTGTTSSSQKKPRSAIDGITFKLRDSKGVDAYLEKFVLPDLQILSFDEIDTKFKFDWDSINREMQT